jgi:hypothetical protein
VTDLYRVFPYDENAAPHERGGALFIPDPAQGRISNPDLYREIYAAGSPNAAIAERFGRFARWRSETFRPENGPAFGLAHFVLDGSTDICDLDDVTTLRAYGIERPTDVITLRRRVTQSWARRIFESNRWDGISWWSHYYPTYRIFGIWSTGKVSLAENPVLLTIDLPEVAQTAGEIVRQRDPQKSTRTRKGKAIATRRATRS